uniref:zinc finger protein RFP-like n=1 Tax=Euleptes europaea TaxID=460621 RepID=UPI00254036CE|nr:zinc finger protein RFP-like [Euleptes europaea]
MAAGGLLQELCEEASCSVCLDFFRDPVTIAECGHNFCRACLTRSWGASRAEASCPQCRGRMQEGSLRPNKHLANFVQIAKKFTLQEGKEAGRVCQKHQEPLKLFCKDDEALICVVCDRSKEHRNHETLPLEEASQEYKKQTTGEKQETVAKFRQLHSFLEEQEKLLLAQMEEVEKEVARNRVQHLVKLSEALSSLDNLIQEMEEKSQQPASELLQDARCTLQRYEEKEEFEDPVAFPLAQKWCIWDLSDLNLFLESIKKQFEDTLDSGFYLQKACVTLDPDTAHPGLLLSENWKSVRDGEKAQALLDDPERFSTYTAVLGCERFTAGRHFWEVLVGSEERWAVGVARESVRRKGRITFGPERGIWAVGKWCGHYRASIKGQYHPLSLTREPKRIRVCLNYAGGRVAFFDADRGALIHEFSGASFSGETLLPFFWVNSKAHLKLSSS